MYRKPFFLDNYATLFNQYTLDLSLHDVHYTHNHVIYIKFTSYDWRSSTNDRQHSKRWKLWYIALYQVYSHDFTPPWTCTFIHQLHGCGSITPSAAIAGENKVITKMSYLSVWQGPISPLGGWIGDPC